MAKYTERSIAPAAILSVFTPISAVADPEKNRVEGLEPCPLLDVCQDTTIALKAISSVWDNLFEVEADDPAHDGMLRLIDKMLSEWRVNLQRLTEIKATTPAGLLGKARLLEELLDLKNDIEGEADPSMDLAASLAVDVIRCSEILLR